MSAESDAEKLLREAAMMPMFRCKDFVFRQLLGAGANGGVCVAGLADAAAARHPFPTKLYAVKVMFNYHGAGSSGGTRNAFEAEFRLLASLPRHPGLVRILSTFSDEVPGEVLAMLPPDVAELVSTNELGQRRRRIVTQFGVFEYHPTTLAAFRRGGPPVLPWADFKRIAMELIDVFIHLDGENVLHRDVKADNVLLSEDGHVVLCDLGEALQLTDSGRVACVPVSSPGGNQSHTAPEVLTALRVFLTGALTATVDYSGQAVFELGVLLCEVALREHPLDGYPAAYTHGAEGGITYTAADVCVLGEDVGVELAAAGYPAAVVSVLGRMVACNAGDRPSLGEVRAAVGSAGEEEGGEWELARLRAALATAKKRVEAAESMARALSMRADAAEARELAKYEREATLASTPVPPASGGASSSSAAIPLPLAGSSVLSSVAPERLDAFLRELASWLPGRAYTLLYRGSRDGMTAAAFHGRCDGVGPTLVLVRCSKGWVFGGYAGASWETPGLLGKYIACGDAFLFSVTGPYTTAPVRFPVRAAHTAKALWCHPSYGPVFTDGLCVQTSGWSPADCFNMHSYCLVGGKCYEDAMGRGDESLTGERYFAPVEVEVYGVARV